MPYSASHTTTRTTYKRTQTEVEVTKTSSSMEGHFIDEADNHDGFASLFRKNSLDQDTEAPSSSDSGDSVDCYSLDDSADLRLKYTLEDEHPDARTGTVVCEFDDHADEPSREQTTHRESSQDFHHKDDPQSQLYSTLRLRQHRYGSNHSLVASAWNDIGNYFSSSGDNSKALGAYQNATNCNQSREVARAYLYMAVSSLSVDNVEESIHFCQCALNILNYLDLNDMERCPDVASVYHQLGNAFCRKKRFAVSLDYLDRAKLMYRSVNDIDDAFVATVMDSMGKVLFMRGDSQAALDAHANALGIFFAAEHCDRAATQCLENIANICCKQSEYERSIQALTKKMQLHSRFLSDYQANPAKKYLVPIEVSAIIDTAIAMGKIQDLRGHPTESRQCQADADFLHSALRAYQDERVV